MLTDNYPKFIITLDDAPATDYAEIQMINAMDFVLEEAESASQVS